MLNEETAIALAECRRAGTLCDLPLNALANRAEAESFQAKAVAALGGQTCGYKIGATSDQVQQLLNCREPIWGPIMREHVLPIDVPFPIPLGFLGIECEFGFRMGSDFPLSRGSLDSQALRSAIAECFAALEFVGRRVTADIPLSEASAIADFAVNVAVVRGAPVPDWESEDLGALQVRAKVDDTIVATGTGAMVLGHPLNALLWLADTLQKRGRQLRKGEIVLTGTCTGVTKVVPGQVFAGFFGNLPPIKIGLVSRS